MADDELERRGFKNVKTINSRSGEHGSWIEWTKRIYVGQKDGGWYEITEHEEDNPYKGPPSTTWSERKLTAQEAARRGLK